MSSTNVPVPPVVHPGSGNSIIRLNPVLNFIRNVGTEYAEIPADFQVGRTAGVLFLSLRYHRLHPEYIYGRIESLGRAYNLRILLVLCDISDHREPIRELTKTSLINNITVIVSFSTEEAGHYLSIYKQFEHKPPNIIKERIEKGYDSLLRTSLTSISKINKTDVETLRTSFGSFSNIVRATRQQLQNLPGFGPVKVKNIKNAFEKPIRNKTTVSLGLTSEPGTSAPQAYIGQSQRETSLPWDIELEESPDSCLSVPASDIP
ncbi:hypothetical protein AX15_002773 [Amanita polypyramis BW_CC]|nr:hypothetical protein AX15_002773 [Amanita polypyramis BW_CC]